MVAPIKFILQTWDSGVDPTHSSHFINNKMISKAEMAG
jgi:hypothetical protein